MSDFSKVLYGLDKNGGYKVWSIWTEGAELYIMHGKLSGKQQTKQENIQGKNIGRSNETTPAQQAVLEATSRYNKQVDKGYRENKEELTELSTLPMLASDYNKVGHRITYPCYGSAKLDGVRCLASKKEDESVELKSRGGKMYCIPHIQEQLSRHMNIGDMWDGELYLHGKCLEEIVSAVKKPNEYTPQLNYVLFDIVSEDTFEYRLIELQRIRRYVLDYNGTGRVSVLPFCELIDELHMKDVHAEYVTEGYEGIMLRNYNGAYESGKRSSDLQKYKTMMDSEFEIVDVAEDKNGGAVFVVQNTFADNQFNVVGGSHEQRKAWLDNKNSMIGKKITVKYQTLFKDTKIPQFPVFVVTRDYE